MQNAYAMYFVLEKKLHIISYAYINAFLVNMIGNLFIKDYGIIAAAISTVLAYIVIVFVVFPSFAAVNIFAGEVDKAKVGEFEFAKVVSQNCDIDLNIDANSVSDDELKSVVGNVNDHTGGVGSVGNVYDRWESKNVKVKFGYKKQFFSARIYILIDFLL